MKIPVAMLSALCAVLVSSAHARSLPMQACPGFRLLQTVDVKGRRLFIGGETYAARRSLT